MIKKRKAGEIDISVRQQKSDEQLDDFTARVAKYANRYAPKVLNVSFYHSYKERKDMAFIVYRK